MEAPQEDIIALPAAATAGGVDPCPTNTQGTGDDIPASPGFTPNDESPPTGPTTSPAGINLPGSAEISPRGNTVMPLAKICLGLQKFPQDVTQ